MSTLISVRDATGNPRPVQADNPVPVSLSGGDIQIGAVELKNATTDDRAKIALLSDLASTDLGLGISDPVTRAALIAILGATNGAAVVTDANGTAQQYLRGIIKTLATGIGKIAGIGYNYQSGAIQRPNDSAPYLARDVIGTTTAAGGAVIEITNIGPIGGDVFLTDLSLEIDVASIPSGMTSFRLQLYRETPPSNLGDNAAWDLATDADRAVYAGYVDLGSPVDEGSTLYVQQIGVGKKVRMGTTTSLWGYLMTNGGYTPTAQAVKRIGVDSVQA